MLVLIPSRLEVERLLPGLVVGDAPVPWPALPASSNELVMVGACGVGAPLSGVRTARLLATLRPRRVILAGLAGSYDEDALPLGASFSPQLVELHGVGVGEGRDHLSLGRAGAGLAAEAEEGEGRLELGGSRPVGARGGGLLTVCAATASAEELVHRRQGHPACLAEDMEGWAVARAAREASVPLTILRGISNRAGERHRGSWRLTEAFDSLRAALEELLEEVA